MRNQPRNLYRVYITLILAIVAAGIAYLFQPASPASAQTVNCSSAYYIDHTFINGARWDMCWEHRSREGIVFYDIYYTPPNGPRRKILAQANLAQIHVPYDDNGARYHDVTDYGLGNSNLEDLSSGDCFNGTLLQYSGKDAICQQVSRRGFAFKSGNQDADGYVLSLFHVAPVGAYNYIIMWRFHDDGALEPTIGATGRLQRRGSNSLYGWPIRSNSTTGISHLHNYYWRLDFDLGNTGFDDIVEEIDLIANSAGNRRTLSVRQMTTEEAASVDSTRMRTWRIRDGAITNADGHAISYELEPLYSGHRDEGPGYEPWTLDDFYVTRYNSCENYISHNPTSGGCGDDVTDFVNGQSLLNQDLVLWYGLTFHHIPRDEDEPNMHAHWNGFMMSPRDVTARNPLVYGLTMVNPGDQTNLVGETVNLTISATEPNGLPLTFSATGLPTGLNLNSTSGQISGAANTAGTFNTTITVDNGQGQAESVSFTWTINDIPNTAPTITNPGQKTHTAGDAVNLSINANDADGDPLTFSSTGLPTGLTIDSSSGQIQGTVTTAGTYNVTVTVSDGDANASTTFVWVVNEVVVNTCGPLMQEAEMAQLGGAFTTVANGSASGGQYIEVPDRTGNGSIGSVHQAQFCFNITEAGTYRLVSWVWSPDNGSNSFYVSIGNPSVADYLWSTPQSNGFVTDYVNNRGGADPVEFYLEAGQQTIIIYLREDGTRLDKLLLELTGGGSNLPPTITSPGNQLNGINSVINLPLSASDPENDTLSFSATGLPGGLTIDTSTGTIAGTLNSLGSYNVTVTVNDGNNNSDRVSFSWIVNDEAVSNCGPLAQEAELAQLNGAFTVVNDASASGGQYIETPRDTGVGSVSSPHWAEFCFSVAQAGTYKLRGTVSGPNIGSNSFYVTVDGTPAAGYKWHIPTGTTFVDNYVSHNGADVALTLAAGDHTVIVYLREDRARLDKLVLEQN